MTFDYPQREDYDGHAAYREAVDRWENERDQAPGPRIGHTCLTGPLCLYWFSATPWQEDPGFCIHDSCNNIVMTPCQACFMEAMDADAAQNAAAAKVNAVNPVCLFDGTPLTFRAFYGAPGYGQSWDCERGHGWAKVGGEFYDPADEAHILTIGKVM